MKVVRLKNLGEVQLINSKGSRYYMSHFISCENGFTRKARYVANIAMTDTPVVLFYLSVVSCDSVRIALLVASLIDLDILACDISNAYLNAPFRERIWFVAGLDYVKSLEFKVI